MRNKVINRWKSKYEYIPEKKFINTGFDTIETIGMMTVPISILRANILTPKKHLSLSISQTPHYAWIYDMVHGKTGKSEKEYRKYIARYYPHQSLDESIRQTKKIIQSILSKKDVENIEIVVFPPIEKNGNIYITIFDGNHRAAITKAMGYNYIKVRVMKYS